MSDDYLQVGASYFEEAFGSESTLIANAEIALDHVDFDTMVGTGLSGSLVIPVLARHFGVNMAIVRKEYTPHDDSRIVGRIGHKWLFVDDFISTGSTRIKVIDAVEDVTSQGIRTWNEYRYQYDIKSFPTTYVGTYEYGRLVRSGARFTRA
jgi:orotate phosphoribosyltransferase